MGVFLRSSGTARTQPYQNPAYSVGHASGTSNRKRADQPIHAATCRRMANKAADTPPPRPRALPHDHPGHGGEPNEARPAKRANPAVGLEAGGGVRRQVGHTGFEPVTSCVSYKRASQLRQWPEFPSADGKDEDSRGVEDRQGGGSSDSSPRSVMKSGCRPPCRFRQRRPARS